MKRAEHCFVCALAELKLLTPVPTNTTASIACTAVTASFSSFRPGGIIQEYNTAKPIVEQLLRAVGKDMELSTPYSFKILDDSDAVVAWEQDTVLAVLFATGDTLRQV